jgi:prepilin-type N-terminal cleavage/methylation domain-containing protein
VAARPAFTLLELVAAISVMSILLFAGAGMMGDNGAKARRTTSDTLSGMIEQGRGTAITKHSQVLLAIAEPGDLPIKDNSCRLALFKLTEFDKESGKATGELLRRWDVVTGGVALIGGEAEGFRNVMDFPEIELSYGSGNRNSKIQVHGVVFTPRGGREWPLGSEPVVMRIAEGGYRGNNKEASANKRAGKIAEDRLKIGRVIARPQRFDP